MVGFNRPPPTEKSSIASTVWFSEVADPVGVLADEYWPCCKFNFNRPPPAEWFLDKASQLELDWSPIEF